GYTSGNWTPMGAFHLGPAKIKNAFHLFLARDCELTREQNLDDTEEIRVVTFTQEELSRLFNEGKITDVDSCLGWLLASTRYLGGSS
ncbi:MAG: NUDIX hydrolase, partial [Candidatus Hinthialibacter sp.]